MRIVRYTHTGDVSYGFLTADGIVSHKAIPGLPATVREFIAAGIAPSLDGLPTIPLAEVVLDVPVELGKVVCAGVNFAEHRVEGGDAPERPAYPVIFTRFPDSHVAAGQPIIRPAGVSTFDYEGELGVVIGKRAWQVRADEALDHVFGYTPYNDGSVREWQFHSHQWIPGKNAYRTGAIGPAIVTADEVPAIDDSVLVTTVNGTERQRFRLGDALFSVAELIAYVSRFTPLEPGDVIAGGTGSGVGAATKTFLNPGDVLEIAIDGIGALTNTVAD